jgi:3-deoxy-D-manno-octulosonic-acid transferase
MVLRTYAKLREEIPALRVLIAPRHIERLDEVITTVQAMEFSAVRRTRLEEPRGNFGVQFGPGSILVLDTVGELAEIYAAADVAFVGGSLIERGGHNVLEPVLRGVPVIFGPHVANFREAVALVQSARVGQMVSNEDELYIALRDWLTDEAERQAVVQRAETALMEHRGAAQRVAELVAGMLQEEKTKRST